jgi:hypothetical protein
VTQAATVPSSQGLTALQAHDSPVHGEGRFSKMKLDVTAGSSRPSERMKQSKSAATAATVSKQAPMHRVIYDALQAEIQQGQYRTGDRLPSELERMATSEWKFSVLPPWHEKGGEPCARLLSGTLPPLFRTGCAQITAADAALHPAVRW